MLSVRHSVGVVSVGATTSSLLWPSAKSGRATGTEAIHVSDASAATAQVLEVIGRLPLVRHSPPPPAVSEENEAARSEQDLV